jgi:hypothetical protein
VTALAFFTWVDIGLGVVIAGLYLFVLAADAVDRVREALGDL